jgi:hypothetical protein
MLYAIGEDFTGFELEALWDDATFGMRHWRGFRRVAVVADQQWLRAAVSMFAAFFPCEIRLFTRSEMVAQGLDCPVASCELTLQRPERRNIQGSQ